MAVGAHRRQHHGIGLIQVDQDIAGVAILSIGVEVNLAALAIAYPQKTNGRQVRQLCGRPQSLSETRPLGQTVDQPNQVKLARHGRQLAADSLRGEDEPRSNMHPILQSNWVAVQ
jgi:hypothetical protein